MSNPRMSDTVYQKHMEARDMSSAPGYPNIKSFAQAGAYLPNTVTAPPMIEEMPVENRPKQCCYNFTTLGIIHIVCAVATWIICAVPIFHCSTCTSDCIICIQLSGAGYTAGTIYLVTGILGIIASVKRTKCVVTAFFVTSIISSACCIFMFVDSMVLLVALCLGISHGKPLWLLACIPLAFVSLVEMAVAVISCAIAYRTGLTCCTCCCARRTNLQPEEGEIVFHPDTNQKQ